ncbi:hypothetical protein D8B26_004197 [Coccidioides posadasii str. Silveira]|uniref:uncharacterized protein n=1 Tax=Coccidioides posadasii (strain RMSCC 757 / Silveira) TaxID=443226 RepID=UPI001BED45EC|nr:hypothetical protein D8B26_004197 [Coccidioides posadasii str. Silveira]
MKFRDVTLTENYLQGADCEKNIPSGPIFSRHGFGNLRIKSLHSPLQTELDESNERGCTLHATISELKRGTINRQEIAGKALISWPGRSVREAQQAEDHRLDRA